MKLDVIYGNIKVNNSDRIVLVKSGNFFKTFYDDALIMWQIFGFNIGKDNAVYFQVNSLGSVISRLLKAGISVVAYISFEEVSYTSPIGNTYYEYLDNAKSNNDITNRINNMKELVEDKLSEDMANYELIDEFIRRL